ncbi:MAG: hypothetical protein KDK28_03255 [Maritimibacter sp.]|nr:hypothetical protein [Maritimibacter sp.]
MMICKADFEELFPELFRPSEVVRSVDEPSAKRLERWEDDGGRTTSANIIPLPHRRPIQEARRGSSFEVRSLCPPVVEVRLVELVIKSPSSPSRDLCILVRSRTGPVSKIDRLRPKTKVSSWSRTKTFSGFFF